LTHVISIVSISFGDRCAHRRDARIATGLIRHIAPAWSIQKNDSARSIWSAGESTRAYSVPRYGDGLDGERIPLRGAPYRMELHKTFSVLQSLQAHRIGVDAGYKAGESNHDPRKDKIS
jgi:hypothetical protein